MSLTSYQAAPPRAMKILGHQLSANRKTVRLAQTHLSFDPSRLRWKGGRTNSYRDGELVGPRFRGALVSEETAGRRPIVVVCAAFRFGRDKLDVLFRARAENGGAVVRCDAGWFHVRCKTASTVFVSFDEGEAVAARFTKPGRSGCERER